MTLAARPDLRPRIFGPAFRAAWPEFMMHDPTADLYFEPPHFEHVQHTAFAVIDDQDPATPIGRAFAAPFALHAPGRGALPGTGWDGVVRWAAEDRAQGRPPDCVSAMEITLLPAHRGQGGSGRVLRAMAAHVRSLGFADLYVPVRPTAKHLEPHTPMQEYVQRNRPDGLPADPWLRVHVRAGGRIVKIAPCSMVIAGSVAEWECWCGITFPASGPHPVPGGLTPLHVSLEQNHAVYVEPNIWVHHDLTRPAAISQPQAARAP